MKNLLIFALLIGGAYFYFTWKPSTTSIVNEMEFGKSLAHKGVGYHSEWGASEYVTGYVRRIDRHYKKIMPVITYDLVLTSGDFSNPDIVNLRHKGEGNYYWSADVQPKGSIIFYHTVPGSHSVQYKLDDLQEGDNVKILAKISQNHKLTSDTGSFYQINNTHNHKIILVEDVIPVLQ